jgi:hypothetical protein
MCVQEGGEGGPASPPEPNGSLHIGHAKVSSAVVVFVILGGCLSSSSGVFDGCAQGPRWSLASPLSPTATCTSGTQRYVQPGGVCLGVKVRFWVCVQEQKGGGSPSSTATCTQWAWHGRMWGFSRAS